MNESLLVFTDEAGVYNKMPSEPFRRSHPFYIRSNTCLSSDDYRLFQGEVQALNKRYGIPVGEEVKWSDLWEIHRGKYRAEILKGLSEDKLKGYYRRVLQYAAANGSLLFLFTVTCVFTQPCYHSESELLKFHLQEAMQRVNMDAQPDDFATIIMDELNHDKIKKLKAACHEIAVTGDLIKYKNIYAGVLTESSSQSPGIQLADFAAGILNGYLRGALLSRGKYAFATDLFNEYIRPNLRCHADGRIMGYGVREVPSDLTIRKKLSALFESE
ncbi:MAG: DUF3800 domain-containing protein [Clostridia bacterium]|nr:DUF3800 domain-containing protein [Clostridia bacterium]